jgi:HAD domain in Swiss Army Knife RNA repair proteins
MKLLLDFDGVICLRNQSEIVNGINYPVFDSQLLDNLELVINQYDIKGIVISSTWREDKTIDYLKDCFYRIGRILIGDLIVDSTTVYLGSRDYELKRHCSTHIDDYLIIEDAELKFDNFIKDYLRDYNRTIKVIKPKTKEGLINW